MSDEIAQLAKRMHDLAKGQSMPVISKALREGATELVTQAAEISRLRRILARYGDRVPMAMCHRPDWQKSIDDAMQWVADNPEASRDQLAVDRSEPYGRASEIRPGFYEDDMP